MARLCLRVCLAAGLHLCISAYRSISFTVTFAIQPSSILPSIHLFIPSCVPPSSHNLLRFAERPGFCYITWRCVRVFVCSCACSVCQCACVCACALMCVCVCVCACSMCLRMCVCIFFVWVRMFCVHACVHVCLRVCISALSVHVCVHS